MTKKIISVIAVLAMILAVPAFSLAAGGADTVTSATAPKTGNTTQTYAKLSDFSADIPYTLEEMLTYAIKDEYAAQALYSRGLTSYSSEEPFARLLQEENGLIDQLTLVLADRGVKLPDLTAVPEQQAFASLREECLAAIRAEKISIEMYIAFLAKNNLPYDVRDVFQLLMTSSQSHLDALNAKAIQEGWIQSAQYQDDLDKDVDESGEDGEDDKNDD
jgi:hypothetical protein